MNVVVERLRTIRVLVGLVFRSDARRAAIALSPIIPVSSGLSFLAGRQLLQALPRDDTGGITRAAVTFTAAFIGTVWLGRVVRTTRIQLGEITSTEFNRRRVEAVLAPTTVGHLDRPDYLDRLETIRGRIFEVQQTPRMLGWLVDSGGGILVSAFLLLSVEPLLGLVVLGGIPAALANSRAQRRVEELSKQQAATNRRAVHLYDLATRPTDAKEVRVAGIGEELLRRYEAEWRAADRALLTGELRAGMIQGAGWLAQTAVFAVGVLALVRGVRDGDVSAGDIFLALGAMGMVVGQFGQAAGGLSNIGRVSRLFEALGEIEAEGAAGRPAAGAGSTTTATAPPARLQVGVELDGVGFRYPGANTPALSDVQLRLPPGSVTAVVGENGAGKSTLVKLLFGLYAPTEGRILVEGEELTSMDADGWRRRTSACFQDFLKLELVARESIGAGDLDAMSDHERVLAAATRAASADTVAGLSDGLETQLGQRFGGAELSGGQWQKVAIARAMMRTTPLLLALDEPTGALDPMAEQEIFRGYTELARSLGRTTGAITVLVAHRFSTVRLADQIVVLDHGRVLEVGDHDTLVAAGGRYAELYELQAKHYR